MLFCAVQSGGQKEETWNSKLQALSSNSFRQLAAVSVLCIVIAFPLTLYSQINAWTNSGNGNWEDLRWSLGQRPGPGQLIQITNSGWKAVAINSGTVQSFSQSLA